MGSSSDHHKSHKQHSKHKKHRHHHKHKHRHKKSHKRDKSHDSNHEVDLASDILGKTLKSLEHKEEINTSTLELVMTEHLLSRLEAAQNESDDSESSADEKSPVPSDKTLAIINDPQVTSTSNVELSNKPSNIELSNKPSNRLMTINIISKTLPSNIDSTENNETKIEPKKSSTVTDGSSDNVMVTYSNLSQTANESSSTNATKTDAAAEVKETASCTQSEGDGKERKNRKRSSSRSPSRSKESSKKRRRSRSHSRSRRSRSRDRRRSRDKRSHSRDKGYKSKRRSCSREDRSKRRSRSREDRSKRRSRSRDRSKRSRSRDRSKRRSRSRDRSKRSRSRDRSKRSRSRDRSKRSRSRDRRKRSSYQRRSRSPRRNYSRRKSPRRRHRSSSSSSYSRSKSRSSSRPGSSSNARMEAESESNFSRYQVVQSVSQIAKEFGSLKRHIEIGKLTSLCAQLQDKPAATVDRGKGTLHEYRTPYEVNSTTRTFEPKLTNQTQAASLVVLPRRPMEEVFPVSTGVEHAGVQKSVATGDNVFEQTRSMPVNELVTKRLDMSQRLAMNPGDQEARMSLSLIEQQMSLWAQSGMKPGQYTGKQTLNPLSTEQHRTGFQTWVKKNMFHHLAPVVGGFGLKMLKKMGWQEGRPLGIHGRGQVEPIALDVKMDRSGLKSSKETVGTGTASSSAGQPRSKVTPSAIAQSKHPVSALQEISQKRHWSIPQYEMVPPTDGTPFLFKVILPIGSYVPLTGSSTKKEAKVNAAAVALSGLGLTTKTLEYSFSAL